MISLEDRLRIVLRDTAREIEPESVRPLDLGTTPAVRADRRRFRRSGRTLAALSAAAAVTAVVVASAVLASGPHARHPLASSPPRSALRSTQPGSQPRSRVVVRPYLPPYLLELTVTGRPFSDNPLHAAIKATASGATLAVITPPAPDGTFSAVTAADDGRTFVLAAQPWQPHRTSIATGLNAGPVTFYLLRFSPGDTHPVLTRLPIPAIQASEETAGPAPVQLAGLSLSPNGAELAVATNVGLDSQQIAIYNVGTGAARIWTAHVRNDPLGGAGNVGEQNVVDPQALSWSIFGTLAYQAGPRVLGVELLDVSGTGGSLQADSRLVVSKAARGAYCSGDAMITPEGSTIVCPAIWNGKPGLVETGFAEFSARTGGLLRVLDKQLGDTTYSSTFDEQVLWTGAGGGELIVDSELRYPNRVSVLTGSHLTLLPQADQPEYLAAVW